MKVLITGASGLIGTALTASLRAQGHEPVPLVRTTPRPGERRWDPARGELDDEVFDGVDGVVHLAGAGIGSHRWTGEYKRVLRDSRVGATALLAEAMARLDHPPRVLVSGSAIGWYGDRGDELLTEASQPGAGFLAELCRDWERATRPASEAGVRVAHIRTGIVLSPDGGALARQLPLFRMGLGGRFGNGRQWQSWISIDDEVAAIEHLLTHPVSGAVNLTAPEPVTNAELTATLGRVLHRPAPWPIPRFAPALLLGGELVDAVLFNGQRVVPSVLQESGFSFAHPTLEPALRALLDRRDARAPTAA